VLPNPNKDINGYVREEGITGPGCCSAVWTRSDYTDLRPSEPTQIQTKTMATKSRRRRRRSFFFLSFLLFSLDSFIKAAIKIVQTTTKKTPKNVFSNSGFRPDAQSKSD
jgi:hypothetical protein